jgi:hypothetical protein
MKKFLYFGSVLALLGLVGCGSDSGSVTEISAPVATVSVDTSTPDTSTQEVQNGLEETPTTLSLPAIPQIPAD